MSGSIRAAVGTSLDGPWTFRVPAPRTPAPTPPPSPVPPPVHAVQLPLGAKPASALMNISPGSADAHGGEKSRGRRRDSSSYPSSSSNSDAESSGGGGYDTASENDANAGPMQDRAQVPGEDLQGLLARTGAHYKHAPGLPHDPFDLADSPAQLLKRRRGVPAEPERHSTRTHEEEDYGAMELVWGAVH